MEQSVLTTNMPAFYRAGNLRVTLKKLLSKFFISLCLPALLLCCCGMAMAAGLNNSPVANAVKTVSANSGVPGIASSGDKTAGHSGRTTIAKSKSLASVTVTYLSQDTGNPGLHSYIEFYLTFSGAITGLTSGDLAVVTPSGAAVSGTSISAPWNMGNTWVIVANFSQPVYGNVTLELASEPTSNNVTGLPYIGTYSVLEEYSPAPTTQANAVNFTNTGSSGTTIGWTSGNGNYEAVFMSQGSSGSPAPAKNTTYNANAAFGSGDQIGTSGWYCVYNGATGSANSVTVSNLSGGTTYNTMVVDYNSAGPLQTYLTSTVTGNPATVTTITPPTISNVTFTSGNAASSAIADYGDQVTLNFTTNEAVQTPLVTIGSASSNDNVTLTANGGNSYTATYLLAQWDSPDASGNVPYTIAVTDLSGNTANYSELTAGAPNVTFNTTPSISETGTLSSFNTALNQPSQLQTFTVSGVNIQSDVTVTAPVGFEVSTVNYNFSPMAYLDVTGGGMFGPGTLAPITVYVRMQSSASPGTVSGNITLTSNGATEVDVPVSGTVGAAAPTTQASSVTFANTTATQTTVNWTQGNGTNEVVFIAPTDSVSAAPTLANNTTYNASATYRAGGQDGSGSYYCVFNGATGSAALAVDHLTPGENYTVYVFDYNGTPGSEQYTTATASGNPATVTTLTPNNATVGLMDNGQTAISFTVNFSNPSISGLNVNNFTVSSSVPGLNPVVTAVNYWGGQVGYQVLVSYNSNYNGTVTLTLANSTGITPAVTNLPQSYTFTATVTAPFNQASQVNFSNTTSSATTINWTSGGSSTGEAVFISQGNSGSPSPVNNTTYNANAAFGSGDQIGSSGWYCVYNGAPAASVNVSGLSANTTYNVMVMDYNGVSGGEQYLTSTGWNNPATVTTQSNDATLSNITVSQGTLDQSFSPTTLSYTEELVYDGSPFTLTPVPNNANATVSITFSNIYNSNAPLNGGVFMAYGTNTFNITVTAQDGVTTMAYTVTVTATRPTPTIQASNVTVTNTSQTGTTINWTPGNGTSEAVFLENSSVHGSPSPVNNTTYTASTVFQSGTQIGGSGWYCIYNGAGSSAVSVTGLSAGSPYQVMVVDYDGAPGSEQYLTVSASGNPLAFPTLSAPQLFTGAASGTISACAGTASVSPNVEQFSVSGNYLTDNITVTAPTGFELSLDGTNYGSSVTVTQNGGTVNSTTVYARSAAADAAGAISGNAVASSSGASSLNVGLSGTVNALATVGAVTGQTVGAGAATAAVNFSGTATSYSWTNDTPGIGLAASGTGNIASFTAANNGSSPVTANITATPLGGFSYAYVANSGSNTVSVINTATNTSVTAIQPIQVGSAPYGVAASPDGKTVYVTNKNSGSVSVISTVTNTVTSTFFIGVNSTPEGIVVSPDGTKIYVADAGSVVKNVAVINVSNPFNLSLISTISLAEPAQSLVISPDGNTLYASVLAAVYKINLGTGIVTQINTNNRSLAGYLAISPDGTTVYNQFPGDLALDAINTTTNSVTVDVVSRPIEGGMVISADGTTLYGAPTVSDIVVFNTATHVVSTIPTPTAINGLSLTADGSELYAISSTNGAVNVFSTTTLAPIATIPVGISPESYGNFIATVSGCSGTPTTFTITVNPSPSITASTGTLTALSTTAGTASASTSFNVSATWLQSGLLVTPPAGFEVSTDGNTYNSTVTLTGDNTGTLASTPVYVRLASADAAGSYSGNIQLTSTNATTATEAVSGTALNPAPTTVASNVGFTSTTTTATTINWTHGNGSNEVVFIAAAPAYPPLAVNNTTYTANTVFGTGSWQCVFNGSGNSVNVTGLTSGATYNVYVFDYNGTPGSEQYLDNLSTNTGTVTTPVPPTTVASITAATTSPTNATTLSYTVTFAEALTTPPSTGDFTLTGTATGTINTISGSGATYTVTVTNISGNGSLELDMTGGSDAVPNISNVPFTGGAYTIDNTQPTAANITFSSNNANPAIAVAGNVMTLSFTASETIQAPTVKIEGNTIAAVNTSGNNWTATYTMQSTDSKGRIPFTLQFSDLAGNTSSTYTDQTQSIDEELKSTDALLDNLTLSNGTLNTPFATNTTSYNTSVGNGLTTMTITPTADDPNATITVQGQPATTGQPSQYLTLAVGNNNILIVVTASDGSSTQTYTLVVKEAKSQNNNLLGLAPNTGALSPAFTTGNTTYTETVPFGTSTITLTPATADPTATVTVNGNSPATAASLSVGQNNIPVVVTSQLGTTKTYTVTVTRLPNVTLSSITSSNGTLNPAFASTTLSYAIAVGNGLTTMTVTPTASDPAATITVQGQPVTTGQPSQHLVLAVGPNNIPIVVTGSDHMTTQTYTLVITEAKSGNNNLSALAPNTGTLSPAFTMGNTSYTETVAYGTNTITLTPATADPTATVTVNGQSSTTPVTLSAGQNSIPVMVTAQNGAIQTYTVTVTLPPVDVNLNNITLSNGTLSPAFNASTLSYSTNVGNGLSTMTITPTADDPNATITVQGQPATSGQPSQYLALAVGQNTIPIIVTGADHSTTQTYTIAVTEAKSGNNSLSALTTSNGTLSPAFTASNTSYSESLPYGTPNITLTPTTADPTATVTVNGNSPTTPVTLSPGQNNIPVVVTAQNGTPKTYTVTVSLPAADVNLNNITLSNGTLSPVFNANTTNYSTSVGNGLTTMTVTPTADDPGATIMVQGQPATSGQPSQYLILAVGTNTIPIVVTGSDHSTTQTYTLVVKEAKCANTNLSKLTISSGPLSPAFRTADITYTASVANAISSINVTPTVANSTSAVTVNNLPATSGEASAVNLEVGDNAIPVTVTAQSGATKTYTITVTRAAGSDNTVYQPVSVEKPIETPALNNDGILVHQAISPNGDGINDFLQIDNISQYPDNKLSIMNRNGQLIYEASGYDNSSKVFDGHSNKNGQMQLPGTYFYQLDYTVNGITRHKTGFLVLKY